MAIVFPRDVPLEEFSSVEVTPVDVNQIQSSTFTGKDRIQEFEGDYWRVDVSYRNLGVDLGREVFAFALSLRKSVGTFVVRFPGYGSPRGNARNTQITPLVDGNGQAGSRVLNIKNATPNMQDWLLVGDIIQVGPDNRPHWHTVLADVDTSPTGTASIDVWPAVRNTTVNNDILVLNEPKGLCRLRENPTIPIRPPVLFDFSLSCREVVP